MASSKEKLIQHDHDILSDLERRLGPLHANQGLNFFHVENWYSIHSAIRNALRLVGRHGHRLRNAERVEVRHNDITVAQLLPSFDGFTMLHISDNHVDISQGAMGRLIELARELRYDICVLIGDYRGKTFGPFEAAPSTPFCCHLRWRRCLSSAEQRRESSSSPGRGRAR
jgi:uncharacterized protein